MQKIQIGYSKVKITFQHTLKFLTQFIYKISLRTKGLR